MKYAYEGSHTELLALYEKMNALRETSAKLQHFVALVRSLKGVLDEPKFCGRLAVAAADAYEFTRGSEANTLDDRIPFRGWKGMVNVILEQEQRRVEYFRSRVIMRDWLLPRFDSLRGDVSRGAATVKDLLAKSGACSRFGMEAAALSRVEQCLRNPLFKTVAAASELLDEPCATNGEGQRALEQFVGSLIKGKTPYLSAPEILAEFQLEGAAEVISMANAGQEWEVFIAELVGAIPKLKAGFPGMKQFLEKYPLDRNTLRHNIPEEDKENLRLVFAHGYVHFEWIRELSRKLDSFVRQAEVLLAGKTPQAASPLALSLIAGLGSLQVFFRGWWNEARQFPDEIHGVRGWKGVVDEACKRSDALAASNASPPGA